MNKIIKVLNNNAVIAENNRIILGRGIGFQKRPGESVEDEKIEKNYHLVLGENSETVQQLLEELPWEIYDVADTFFKYARMVLGKQYTSTTRIAIMDHLNGAILRQKENASINNILLWDIKRLFKKEYEVGLLGLEMVEKKMGIRLPDDEAGFLALYLINSDENKEIDGQALTVLIQKIVSFVRLSLNLSIDESSIYFDRFITHIRFLAFRILRGESKASQDTGSELQEIVEKRNKKVSQTVVKVEKFLLENYNYQLSIDDKIYLMIHMNQIVDKGIQ